MKSIKQQYIDLKEGRMTQAQFMRNVRMSLPQYVTNVTSFNDTVKILKNKAILTEADIKENENPYFSSDPTDGDRDFDMESMVQAEEYYDKGLQAYSEGDLLKAEKYYNAALKAGSWLGWTEFDLPPYESLKEADIYGIAGDPEAEAERKSAGMGIKPMQTPEDKYGVNKKIDQSELNFLKKIYAKTPTDKIKQMIDNLENRMNLNESYTTNTSGKELYSRFAEVDNLNGQEVLIGTDYELAKNNNLTRKEATKIVIKNLKKNN